MEKFNNYYLEFLNYISKKFPSYRKYTSIDEKNYLKDFIELNLANIENISIRNIDIFRYKLVDVQLIRGLKFKRVLDHIYDKPRTLESIWRYLHNLYIILYNSCDLKKIVEKRYNNNEDLLKVLDNHNIYIENIMLSGHPIIERDESSQEEEELSDEEIELRRQFENIQKNGEESNKDDNGDESNKNSGDNNDDNKIPDISNMFEGSIIGDLAKELSSEINPNDLGNIENVSDIVNNLFNPNAEGGSNLQNIIQSVTEKMDTKMKNGDITQEQLLNDAQNMMGNMGQLFGQMNGGENDMMANMGQLFGQMSGGQSGGPDMLSNMMNMMSGMGDAGKTNRSARRQKGRRVNKKK